MSIYGTAGQGTYSVSYNSVDSMLTALADNNSNAIHAQEVRNTVWTLWNQSTTINAYNGTHSFTSNTPLTLTHNLNNLFYIIQLWDFTTGEELFGNYSSRLSNSVIITLSQTVPNCGISIK